jgi:hypothetical protein
MKRFEAAGGEFEGIDARQADEREGRASRRRGECNDTIGEQSRSYSASS